MSDHLSKQFDRELENISSRILQMGTLVERQVLAAIEAFSTGSAEASQRVIDGEREVDADEVGIDEDCTLLIARRQLAAGDLRLILAILRIVTDLERIGDKACEIASMSRVLRLAGAQHLPRLTDLDHCGRLATDMLRAALDSLAHRDVEAARRVIGSDAAVDTTFNTILRQLLTYMLEDPRTISEALDILWIAKAIERIGDHATNIAEDVIYVVSGIDIRHTLPKPTDDA
ncbi:MAG: phosphate signaling complex protein PhoU [Candidatus Accumulibacter phosphatis]|uniref:Phosphate-specific transport system accessory protein PhoU n=2 Tax=Candidatus Accumulibacter TaxID=327159 RepID=A0A080MCD1_9PROT|nr:MULTISPECIES: phosphate signaling complex protein PhoU [Candidatus Accumulibacter]KFB78576.1 MAG: Negative regulator of Pho regulon [Candidatus Accumulibacter cognatus]MBL8401873.1 phosphate signaling complex protein PhoU [Accumulibacter sp.]MBN8519829.1 phosphate signaling complex protein PhoU [Accumulibacter sp.]MBO3711536.1 phosphate signaling complex protein PhoU [Accumulibacter sp.]MCM8579522.1 phosphate signaling complex protein PhoU [Accumulibacter sp.]